MTTGSFRSLAGALMLIVVVALCGACASSDDEPAERPVLIEVHNEYTGARQQDISIVGRGAPIALGSIAPGETRTFEASDLDVGELYRLAADAPTGAHVRSQPFDLAPGIQVMWDLATNRLQVTENP